MKSHQSSAQTQTEVPAYNVIVNTTSFQYKKSSLKERIQNEKLLQYWKKFDMDQKHVAASCEDRLSELTIRQIDRIIDMERIKSSISDKKHRVEQIYFDYQSKTANTHPNVYQANFIAKINAVAIKRDIRQQTDEGFDQYINQNQNKQNRNRKRTAVPYKFMKSYKIDTIKSRPYKTERNQDQIKSIESFQDDLDKFEKKINEKYTRPSLKGEKREQDKPKHRRWFYGMSTYYLDKTIIPQITRQKQIYKGNYDIQAEKRLSKRQKASLLVSKKKTQDDTFYATINKLDEPLSKFHVNRLVTIK